MYSISASPDGIQVAPSSTVDSSTFPPGHCAGDTPHLFCPVNAVRNGAVVAAAVMLLGGKKTTAALAGVAAWFAASGLWWV